MTTTADVIGEPESSYKRPNGTEGDGHDNEVEQTKGGSRDRKSTKKDKKKRKSKTKKSKSVIDDIFG